MSAAELSGEQSDFITEDDLDGLCAREIIDFMAQKLGVRKDADVARSLDTSGAVVANWIRRGTVPDKQITKLLRLVNPARHPWDWYVDQPWVTEALINELGSDQFGEVVWDPACGGGTIPRVLFEHWALAPANSEYPRLYWSQIIATDISYRGHSKQWRDNDDSVRWNFLSDDSWQARGHPLERYEGQDLSIVSNPPYSQQDGKLVRGLAEQFCRKALTIATHKVCMLLPLKWMAGEARQRFLTEFPPRYYLILNERPSMPPGNMIEQLGDKAFKRGKVDYMWVVWDKQVVTLPGETRTIHIAPRPKEERG